MNQVANADMRSTYNLSRDNLWRHVEESVVVDWSRIGHNLGAKQRSFEVVEVAGENELAISAARGPG